MINLNKIAVEHTMCPTCYSRAQEPCKTLTGNRVHGAPHTARTRWLFDVWDEGYETGSRETANSLIVRGLIRAEDLPKWLRELVIR